MSVDDGQCGDRGVRLRAVDERQPFLRPERHGRKATCCEHVFRRASPTVAREDSFADEREREVSERCEVAARADTALLRNLRMQARVEHADEQLGELGPSAGVPLRDHVCAQQHHRAHLALGKKRPDARGVAAHEVHLQLRESIGRDGDLRKLAEACRHAVRDFLSANDVLDGATREQSALARYRRDLDGRATGGDGKHLLDTQRAPINHHGRRHCVNVAARRK